MFNCECGADLIQEDCETILDVCQEAPVVKDYETLANKPQINGVTLDGNKTSEVLGITQEITDAVSAEATLRENADTALVGRIDGEATARENADTALGGRINGEITNRTNADNVLGTRIDNEILARQGGDNNLQTQIDAITSKSDVVDVVADYAALQAYDTQHLGNNDVIKVLNDETHDDAQTYYRWNKTADTWTYIGSEAPYYSKGQMDTMLQAKQDNLIAGTNIQIAQDGKTISATDTTYTAGNGLNLNDTEFSADTTVLATKSNLNDYYTKTETDAKLAPKLETEVVSALPATGDSSKLYLTPKAHTTQTATGNPVTATVAEQAGKLESFKLDGDTFQQTYSGKNLFDVEKTPWVSKVAYDASGNRVTWNGYVGIAEYQPVEPETTYTFSNSTGKGIYYGLVFYDAEKTKISNITANTITFTTPQNCKFIRFAIGSNVTEKPTWTQLELGSTSTSYEQFVGGTPSPNPSYPQPIQTVTGEQTVSIIGKNLFNKNAVTNGGYIDTNGEVVAWETFGYSEYIRVIGGQTYSYSGTANNVGYSAKAAWYDSNKNFISAFSFGQSGQVTAPATAKFLRTSVRIASPSGLDTYQLELGSTITTYEAYRATNYPISLGSIELCKLGTYQDYIYKDGSDWKLHKTTGSKVFDGSDDEGWFRSGLTTSEKFVGAINLAANDIYIPWSSVVSLLPKTDYFTNTDEKVVGAFRIYNNGDGRFQNLRFCIAGTSQTVVADLENWLSTHNVIFKYPTTATDTAITDTTLISQLEAIRNAQLATGTSTITNNATAPSLAGDMEIGYYGYNPTNRFDKWIWLDFDNSYEQLNNPEPTATLSTRSLSTTTEQTTPTKSVETITLKKGGADSTEDKTELPTILDDKTEEAVKEEYTEPVEEESKIKEEPEEEISEQVESEKEEETEER